MSDIRLIIDYDNGNIKSVTNDAEKQFSKSGDKSGKGFSDGFSLSIAGVASSLAKVAASAAAIGGITLFKAVKDAASLEVINTQFEVMLKSASAAQAQVQELQDFAASTPFQLEGLAAATTQLLSFGTAQKDIIPTLKTLGDLAAGVGVEIGDLTIPFGRLASTQKLTLIELDKFADKGINIYKQLSDQTGRSLKTIRDDISRGRIPYEEFTTALNTLTGESGIFFQGMEKKSKTLTGVISTLGDNIFNLSANFGKAFSPLVVEGANRFITVIQDLNKKVVESFNVFDDVINPLIRLNDALITYVAAPLELVANIGQIVFKSLVSGIATVVAGFGFLGQKIADLLTSVGLGSKGITQDLKNFAEASSETANQAALDVGSAAEKIFDFSVSDKLANKNEQLRTFFQEQRAIIEEESAITNEITDQQIVKAAEQSQSLASMLVDTFSGVSIGINKTKEEMAKVATQTTNIVKNGLAKGISGGIQNIVTSLAQGEDVFANFGKFLLQTIGDLAIQLGTFFIAEGIAVEALNAVSGTGAIAAGAALVALGSLLKASVGGGSASASASGGSAGSASPIGSGVAPTGEFVDQGAATAQAATVVNFNIDGNMKGDEQFIREIVEDIGTEGGKQGLVFDNFSLA